MEAETDDSDYECRGLQTQLVLVHLMPALCGI